MSPSIYLDWLGDASAPPDVEIIRTEVEFLRNAFSEQPILIRGKALCRWADIFYKGRGRETCSLQSPSQLLSELCPDLDTSQLVVLSKILKNELASNPPPKLVDLVYAIWQEGWWFDPPTTNFAARWLLWFASNELNNEIHIPLLQAFIRQRQAEFPCPEAEVFNSWDKKAVVSSLLRWLGLDNEWTGSTPFPLELTNDVKCLLVQELRPLSLERQGKLCVELQTYPAIDQKLLYLAADVDATYFIAHPFALTSETMTAIRKYLNPDMRRKLQGLVPVSPPGEIPLDGASLERWFLEEYLPYREYADDNDSTTLQTGKDFAGKYLQLYSESLMGGLERDYLSWNRSAQLLHSNFVTLMVVLDGLTYPDMVHLWDELKKFDTTNRLFVESTSIAFAPLPTITEIAKPALMKGVKPILSAHHPDLGLICKKKTEIREALKISQLGKLYIWSILEPDKSYHHAHEHEEARPDAAIILINVARKIAEVVLEAPSDLQLRLVITTDHGRLLAVSQRSVPIPKNMTSSGRGAIGGVGLKEGLVIDGEVAFLHRTQFGIQEDAAIVLTGNSFLMQGGKTGTDAFPHGGAFPEEVLIPWWVIKRDLCLLDPTVIISGRAMSGRSGILFIKISNANSVFIDLVGLDLTLGVSTTSPLNNRVSGMDSVTIELPWGPWPTIQQVKEAKCLLHYKFPNNNFASTTVKIEIIAEDMYGQTDNPLEDLL